MKQAPEIVVAAVLLLSLLVVPAMSQRDKADWIVLAPTVEGFSIQIPAKPEEQVDRVPMMGNTYKMHLYSSADEPDKVLYMAIVQEFPVLSAQLTPAARLDQFMEGFRQGLSKSLSSSPDIKPDMQPDRDLDLKGHIGRQYALSVGGSHGLVRAFDAGRRVYVVLVLGADEKDANVGRFLSSFEIKSAPDPVAVPVPVGDPKP